MGLMHGWGVVVVGVVGERDADELLSMGGRRVGESGGVVREGIGGGVEEDEVAGGGGLVRLLLLLMLRRRWSVGVLDVAGVHENEGL